MNKDEKYSTFKGFEEFNWNEFLNKKKYTITELELAYEEAEGWATCAVGNQCKIIPRDKHGAPLDPRLKQLGVHFMELIEQMEFSRLENDLTLLDSYRLKAKNCLEQIEKRSIQVINEINNQS